MVACAIAWRPLLPVDETRYLTVAWEAHVTGDYLVSHLNTETYAHKPPLLFWLINAVWSITGLNEYAARLVSPLAGIVCLLLTAVMARRLWPESTALHRCAPMVLASITLWMAFCPLTMFDTLLTSCTMLALLGVLRAEAGDVKTGWLIVGAGLGLGILAKGPVVLVHVMPTVLLTPWWSLRVRTRGGQWYAGGFAAIVIASAIGLSWALPSAAAGGKAYSDELLFGQTAGRMVNSFAHRQPFWWYIPFLPLCLLPWISIGTTWRGLKVAKFDSPMKFLICWSGSSLLILSLVSGKQIHYLLPVIPALALILTRLLTTIEGQIPKRDLAFMITGTVAVATMPLFANHISSSYEAVMRGKVADWYVIPLMACGAILIPLSFKRIESAVFAVGTSSILFAIILIVSARSTIWKDFEYRPMAQAAARHEGGVAWHGRYEGQLNYLGELRYIHETCSAEDLSNWLAEHPEGHLIKELSAANADAMKLVDIDASNGAAPSSSQLETITQILRTDPEFPGHDWQPIVTQLYWIRPRLPLRPYVVVRYENPPIQNYKEFGEQ